MTDWRLQGQETYLQSARLSKRIYKEHKEAWEHDHCEFCSAKFSHHEDDLQVGYVTRDGYHWICEECYNDFKDIFRWKTG